MIGVLVSEVEGKELHSTLLKEIKVEIMERVGDREKKFTLDWWCQLAES
jgi:hypothetical protein